MSAPFPRANGGAAAAQTEHHSIMNPRRAIGVDAAGRFRIAGDKPNARKAYSLVLFEFVLLRPRVRACESATVNSFTVARGVVAGGADERNRSGCDYHAGDGSCGRLGALPRSLAQEESRP